MRATEKDRKRLEAEIQRLVNQMKDLGAIQVILFGSLARGQVSLFSDIDLLVLFDDQRSPREITRWVYQNLNAREAVDVIAHNRESFETARERPFLRRILKEGKVLYERPGA
jgi:predicted nucleotidyltransferase